MCNQTLNTRRLILRKFNENDLEAFYDIFSDKEVNQFLPWFPLKNLDEAKSFYQERYASIYQKEQGYAYAICFKKNNTPIGYINIDLDESHDLGYGLKKEYWHQGIVSEAVKSIIQQTQKEELNYLTATHDIKNIPVIFRMYQINLDGKKRIYQKYWNQYEHFIEENI